MVYSSEQNIHLCFQNLSFVVLSAKLIFIHKKVNKNRQKMTLNGLSKIFCGSVENFKNRLKSVENCVESVDNSVQKRWYIKVFHTFQVKKQKFVI